MEKKHAIDKMPETVPYLVFDAEMARQERHIKRLWIALMIAILSVVLVTAAFIWYLNQYDFVGYEQDGQGVNIIGNLNGVDYSGTADTSPSEEEPIDSEG